MLLQYSVDIVTLLETWFLESQHELGEVNSNFSYLATSGVDDSKNIISLSANITPVVTDSNHLTTVKINLNNLYSFDMLLYDM